MVKSVPIHIHKRDLQRSPKVRGQKADPSKIDQNWHTGTLLDADYDGEVRSDSHS